MKCSAHRSLARTGLHHRGGEQRQGSKHPKGLIGCASAPKRVITGGGVDWVQKSGKEFSKIVWPQIGFTMADLDKFSNSTELQFVL